MNFQVEEFKLEEMLVGEATSDVEQLEKRKKLLESLNLPQQKAMFLESGVVPYQRLSIVGEHVWGAFCPHKVELSAHYGYIPTRILEIIETATPQFHRIEVWSEEQTTPDPVLVGILTKEYNSPKFLIARWGESLLAYAEVFKIARDKWVTTRRNKLQAKLKECELDLVSIEEDADKHLTTTTYVKEIF